MASRAGLAGRNLRAESHQRLWEEIRDFGIDAGALCRLTVPADSIGGLLGNFSRGAGAETRYIAHAGTGTVYVSTKDHASGKKWFAELTDLAMSHKGHAVMAAAPAELKQGIDVWGPSPPGLGLMRNIKRQFDPQDTLNSSRFLAGL
jgi:glycolate oxidase FAD binding subunit